MVECVVIGAGVIGASVAYRLAQAGVSVSVLEAGRVGGGTSGVSFAWTNANNKPPRAYHDLNVAGMRAHAALRDEFGETPWWHGGGSVEWASDDGARSDLRERVTRLQAWDYGAEWLTPGQLAELEPDIDPAAVRDAAIVYFPDEGWLDPVTYAHAMLEAAQRAGARLRCAARVTQVDVQGGRVTGVRTAGGDSFGADVTVNCAGRWADDVARLAAARIATRPIPADGYSAVGPLPGVTGHYAVVTHSGVTLAAFLGRAVAEEIAGGRTVPALEPFRPS